MKTYVFLVLALFTALSTLSGCASIVSGGPKSLSIMSQPDAADIEIMNVKTGDTILKAKTPYIASLERGNGFFSKAIYKVKISKENYLSQEKDIVPGINGWYWGNILFGGIIGFFIVDPATGAMWKISDNAVNLKLYPNSPEGKVSMAQEKHNKGNEYCTNGDYDKAIEFTSEAISLNPEYAEAYCTRAKAYDGKDEMSKAIEDLDKAIAIKPDYAEALFQRGNIYYKQKNQEKAKSDMQTACGMNYKTACDFQF